MITISVIMAVFNEEKFLPKSLDALMKQTLKPQQIIVVDDGSTDKSPEIAAQYPVQLVRLPLEKRAMIERVPSVLKAGSKRLGDFDYVAILDADTILEAQYYEKLTARMEADKRIGIACGKLSGPGISTELMLGLIPYVYGSNRLYTKDCWVKINNGKIMKPVPVWDFYHNVYAEMLGYITKRNDEIQSWTLRPPGFKKDFFKGYTSYQLGYYGYFLMLRALRNRSPNLVAGYLKAKFSDETEYPIKPYVRHLQTCRIRRLIKKIIP